MENNEYVKELLDHRIEAIYHLAKPIYYKVLLQKDWVRLLTEGNADVVRDQADERMAQRAP